MFEPITYIFSVKEVELSLFYCSQSTLYFIPKGHNNREKNVLSKTYPNKILQR